MALVRLDLSDTPYAGTLGGMVKGERVLHTRPRYVRRNGPGAYDRTTATWDHDAPSHLEILKDAKRYTRGSQRTVKSPIRHKVGPLVETYEQRVAKYGVVGGQYD